MTTDKKEIMDFIEKTLSEITNLATDKLDPNLDFESYGLSSASAVIMLGELEDFVDMDLSPSMLFDHNTINKLSKHISSLVSEAKA